MRSLTVKKITLAIILSSLSLSTSAAGLGRLNILSALGEPFRAEIDLISTTPEELETLTAVIASDEAYNAQGINRLSIHNDIQVSLTKTGRPKLLLSSSKSVNDPYLDMLIQLDWASGRLQREYTILLDPPEYNVAANQVPAAPVIKPAQPMAKPEMPEVNSAESLVNDMQVITPKADEVKALNPEPVAVPVPVKPAMKEVPARSIQMAQVGEKTESQIQEEINRIEMKAKSQYSGASNDWVAPSQAQTTSTTPKQAVAVAQPTNPTSHRTKSGDNLSKIARKMRVSGVSLNQMLVGLYEHNKSAFVNDNMNRLKVGKVIKLPSKEELLAVARSQANQQVVVHTESWQGYRQTLAGNASPSISVADDKQSESGEITAFEPEKPIEPKETKDVVKLSASDDTSSSPTSSDTAVDAEKEDGIAKDKALKEAEDRTAAVEKQIEDMQKLLKMKNDEMAVLEQNAADNNKPEMAEEAKVQPEPTLPAPVVEEPPVVEKEKPAEPVKPVEKPAPVAEEPSLLEKITAMLTLPILGVIGLVLALILLLLFLRNKRKKDLENFERGILTSGGLRANTVFGNTTGDTSSTDTSFLTDFAQTTDGAMMDANEVDPIAEAEVYMAYGREAQAEEILKEAIKKEPKRHELHLKLLEIYQERKDNSAFETLASELYTTLGDEDPTWQKVSEMGKALEPNNPLYTNDEVPTLADVDASAEAAAKPDDSENIDAVAESIDATKQTSSDLADDATQAVTNVTDNSIDFVEAAVDKVEATTDQVKDSVSETVESADDAMKSTAAKVAGVAGLAAGAVSATGSRIESIVRHEPEASEVPAPQVENDLSLETMSAPIEPAADESVLGSGETPADSDLQNFDLSGISLEIEDETQQAEEEVAENIESALEVPEITLDAPSLDSEEILASVDAENLDENEVEIKLNLVSAYIDMDDKEGARELLEEIIKEGSDDQVMRAQMMKDNLE